MDIAQNITVTREDEELETIVQDVLSNGHTPIYRTKYNNRSSRNVGNKLPIKVVQYPRTAQIQGKKIAKTGDK